MSLLGNIKLLHSVKFRFTFNHVYKHAPLNLKIKHTIISFRFTTPYYYIRTSKLKLPALNSIRYSFNRNKKLVTECRFHFNYY